VPGEEKRRALVVEDEPETALQLKKILEKKFSLEVETALDCATARKKLAGGQFDIVTLDFMLPDGRGVDFLEEITSVDGDIRVIMVTGHGDEETAVRSFRSSASGYVVKDAHLHARLVEAVENALTELDLKAAQEELRRREERYREELEQLVAERTAELAETNVQLQAEIAERKQAEAELKQRAERLADFLTVTSHELRHPVSVVKGYTTMLAGYLDRMEPEDLRSLLDALDVSVDRLTGLIEELMEVSLVEQGRFSFQKTRTDMEQLARTAITDMKARGFNNDISLRVSGAAGPITADPEKLVRLLVILLDNACKFSPASSPIEVEVHRNEGEVVVSVLDRGMGVPDDAQELIFDRFYQVEELKHHSSVGLGLGLYLARQIVSAHNGQIHHSHREGGGSIFQFTIEAEPDKGPGQ
jgi:signal transduction histidine kinase